MNRSALLFAGEEDNDDKAQTDRVTNIHLSGHTVATAQTRPGSERTLDYQQVMQQTAQQQQHQHQLQHQYLRQQHQQQVVLPQVEPLPFSDYDKDDSNVVHDYSKKGPHSECRVAERHPHQGHYMGAGHVQTESHPAESQHAQKVGQEVSYSSAQTMGSGQWTCPQPAPGSGRGTAWAGQYPTQGLVGEQCEESVHTNHRSQKRYQQPVEGGAVMEISTEGPNPSLLQRRISRTEYVQMYSSDEQQPEACSVRETGGGASLPYPNPASAPTGHATPELMSKTEKPQPRAEAGPPHREGDALPEKVASPISYVSEWLRSSTVWGESGYGTPTTADMERDAARFVYPPPSKLLTDSTPKEQHEETCTTHQDEDSNVIQSFLHEQQHQGTQQLGRQQSEQAKGSLGSSGYAAPQGASSHPEGSQQPAPGDFRGPPQPEPKKPVMITPQITLEGCEPMIFQQPENLSATTTRERASPLGAQDSDAQSQLPARNLKISSPKSTHAARRASSPVVSKPGVPFFWHFNPNKQGASVGGSSNSSRTSSCTLTVKDHIWRRYSDSNIPMEPEVLRIKPAIRSKSTGDSTSYEEEPLPQQQAEADSNLLSVAACKPSATNGASRDHHQLGSDDKRIISKRLKLKTYLQNKYEEESAAEDDGGRSREVRMSVSSGPEADTESRMSVSQQTQRSLSQSDALVEAVGAEGTIRQPGIAQSQLSGGQKRQHDSPGKTHLTRAIQSWSLPHQITIKVEPVSPFPLSEDDPETPGSVFTPGVNVPATPTSFLSPGVPGRTHAPKQVFSFNVPPNREMSPPDQRHLRRPLHRQEKSQSLSALAEHPGPRPDSVTSRHMSPPTPQYSSPPHNQRHHSDTVIYTTECKPSIPGDETVKPKEQLEAKSPQPVDMRRSPPGGRKQPPPPLQLAAGLSAFSRTESDQPPLASPGGRMLPPPRHQHHPQQPHISEFLAASAPPAGLRSPAFPFASLPSHLHPHPRGGLPPGSTGYPMLSPGHMTWSAPPSAALLPQPSPRISPSSVPGATGGSLDSPHPMHPSSPLQDLPPQQVTAHLQPQNPGRKSQQNPSKMTLTSMAAIQQLREQQLREGNVLRDPNMTYMCPVCGQLFPSYNYLANHMVNHLPSETVVKGPGENKLHLCKVRGFPVSFQRPKGS